MRLAAKIEAAVGFKVVSLRGANRGHHRADGVIKWHGELADGRHIESEDTMRDCVRADRYLTIRPPARWQDRWQIDANVVKATDRGAQKV